MEKTRKQHFTDVVADVISIIGHSLPPDQARLAVQQAYREIADGHEWFHQRRSGFFILPKTFTGGEAEYTKNSRVIIVNAEIQTYLDSLAIQHVTSLSCIGPDGRYYNISNWFSSTLKIVLATPYFGDSTTTFFSTINLHTPVPYVADDFNPDSDVVVADTPTYKPDTTFRALVSAVDIVNSRQLKYSPYAYKPVVSSAGRPIGTSPTTIHPLGMINNIPHFSFCPPIKNDVDLIYQCEYLTTGGTFTDDENDEYATTPLAFSAELITSLACARAAIWAESNKGLIPTLQRTNWAFVAQSHQARYTILRNEAIRRDYELASMMAGNGGQESWSGQIIDSTPSQSGLMLDSNRIIL